MDISINNYPRPVVPLSPILSWHSVNLGKSREKIASVQDCRYTLRLTSGRAAIALAMKHAGVSQGHEVLVPAFHCESMVAPIRWLGATPVFYRVHPNTSIDIVDIGEKITGNTKAIIITHYFGFLQDLSSAIELCTTKNVQLIEDCAHAFFGSVKGKTVGAQGDYAIASSMKFFPVLDGGLLASNTLDIRSLELQRTPLAFQMKSLVNSIENSISYGRFGVFGKMTAMLLRIKEHLWSSSKELFGSEKQSISTPSSSEGGQELDVEWINRRSSLASRQILAHSDKQRICKLRRANYQRLDEAFRLLPGCHPLHSMLPDNCIPLVYPLYVENAEKIFPLIKQQGIPIWRFGEYLDEAVTDDVCINSVKLSAHIFQFPCHQELLKPEIEWIIESVVKIITSADPEGS